ncbi:heavy-metal-associated domain-containing protein [Glaciibacter superstes]|uniref:heavy-metal-associated domain-containing protein n=1 Tax=Glaciibacter superstes TaxID=501023 RepID=UPI0003B78FB7|nr:heavy metal-associated domain-containing protein [Glaciibacter superstes]
MTSTSYRVTGMTCGHCERSVAEEVTQIEGVTGVTVSAEAGTLIVASSAEIDEAQVLAAVTEAGYRATILR